MLKKTTLLEKRFLDYAAVALLNFISLAIYFLSYAFRESDEIFYDSAIGNVPELLIMVSFLLLVIFSIMAASIWRKAHKTNEYADSDEPMDKKFYNIHSSTRR